MSTLTPSIARDWIARWDRQQEGYLPDREERFTAIVDAVVAGVSRPDPLVLDLGCGPGSLSVRLLERVPRATVVGIDTDPLLLALGRAAGVDVPGLSFADVNLGEPGWAATLEADGPADAAVSTTALHWLSDPQLRAVYAELAKALRPGGLLLNGDHFSADETPEIHRLTVDLAESLKERRFGDDRPEDWKQWWDAVLADPVLSGITQKRATSAHHGSPAGRLDLHVDALREAGFSEVGTLWQHGNNRVLCAVR
ncbi:MAG: class I SAM-dependent methyltransferase [Stackebrandtia sp.]